MSLPKTHAPIYMGLSHPRRIKIYNALVDIGRPTTHGRVQELVGLNAQAMAHHLRQMEKAGLIKRQPKGSETIITLNISDMFDSFELVKFQYHAQGKIAA
ncbi:MAG: winged helix-turn-helix domain-containing protein [Pseudomonadota bacterium]